MTAPHHHEYLEALGIDIWIPRLVEENQVHDEVGQDFLIGPGHGSMLLLCGHSSEAATLVAADIARCLDCEPIWGWPAEEGDPKSVPLELAIEERLITRVFVLGGQLVDLKALSGSQVISSAKIVCSESIPVLLKDAEARKALWSALSTNNWYAEAKQVS